jgi:hypothetical protein
MGTEPDAGPALNDAAPEGVGAASLHGTGSGTSAPGTAGPSQQNQSSGIEAQEGTETQEKTAVGDSTQDAAVIQPAQTPAASATDQLRQDQAAVQPDIDVADPTVTGEEVNTPQPGPTAGIHEDLVIEEKYRADAVTEFQDFKKQDIVFENETEKAKAIDHGIVEEKITSVKYLSKYSDDIEIEYVPLGNGVKENIIIDVYNGINTLIFSLSTGALLPVDNADGQHTFKDRHGRNCAVIPPFYARFLYGTGRRWRTI